ncbi:glutathione S-transferase GST-6.0 [Penicillium samsonianum]|uniref:glutathione S-transferase GST-6.0 n=1 Tax=Penicillium samsonianum TaxID=1882272 RepID=UPI0025490097|nr:glutathione S-transferase GST-6.0 [Penicillium samsonianum]KAJ6125079.1 glutathione S-transferase GST-6.0 [Penicillium samsonianum]
MSTEINLFYSPGACSLAPHILLHETGLPFNIQREKLGSFTPELLSLNPKAKIPTLTLDDVVITENPAIMTAIANMAPEKYLLGRPGTLDSVRCLEWMAWLSGTLHGVGFGMTFRPQRFSERPENWEEVRAKGMEIVKGCFEDIERKLGGVHAVGDGFTVVDAYLFVFWRWGVEVELDEDLEGRFPKYRALAESVKGRETTMKTLQAEGL